MVRRSPSALGVAFMLALAPSHASAEHTSIAEAADHVTSPTQSERSTFTKLRREAESAGRAGDWDTFNDRSAQALAALPESDATHEERAEIMQPVGAWKLETRSEAQLRRSLEILESYRAQLRDVYGDAAPSKLGWSPAQDYIAALRQRLPARSADNDTIPPSTDRPAPPPAPEPGESRHVRGHRDPAERNSLALIAAGGATTGVGAVLLFTGLGLITRWVARAHAYDDFVAPCTATCPGEDAKWHDFTRARATVLGLAITGALLAGAGIGLTVVGLRRRGTVGAHASLAPGGVRIRF